jgi:hypothetical protein
MFNKFLGFTIVYFLFFLAAVKGADHSVENQKEVSPILKKDSLSAVGTVNQNYKIHALRLKGVIKLDGIINEEDWLNA